MLVDHFEREFSYNGSSNGKKKAMSDKADDAVHIPFIFFILYFNIIFGIFFNMGIFVWISTQKIIGHG
jgi:hypothetical protein